MCRIAERFRDIGGMTSRRPPTANTVLDSDEMGVAPVAMMAAPAPAKKSKTPSCIVPSCGKRLRSKYEQRCRLCMTHLKAPQVAMPEGISRWCQKCGKFQRQEDFDDERRSCRVSLLRHMEKQRLARSMRSGHGPATPADSLMASPFAAAAADVEPFSDDATSESLASPRAVTCAGAETATATVSTDPAGGNGADYDEQANVRSHFLSVVLQQAGWNETSFNAAAVDGLPPVLALPEF